MHSNKLDDAPADIQLAVDIILLLESYSIAPDTVLSALEIIKKDYQIKSEQVKKPQTSI